MDAIIQRLQIESLNAQLSLLQLNCAYLAGRCASPDAMSEEAWETLNLLDMPSEASSIC